MIRTHRYRIKDSSHRKWLKARARTIDFIWNWCNNAQIHALRHNQKWPSAFNLSNLSAGSSKELGLHSQTVQAVCEQYVKSRSEAGKAKLRFRGKKSLGWVPWKASGFKIDGNHVTYAKRRLKLWKSREIPEGAKITVGSFSANASGQWFLNITLDIPDEVAVVPNGAIGIDLGLKTMAAGSDGTVIDATLFYRELETEIAIAQRAGKSRQVKALHRKAANRRKDKNQKVSTAIARTNGMIVVGNVQPKNLAKTNMAKSVHDQGWSDFKSMLRYKAIGRGSIFLEVNEAYTTQTCSACFARCGPRGLEGLRIREWKCDCCGTVHDRDINSGTNILRLGHETLAGGSLAL